MRLDQIAQVLRSKNAGPFRTTFDIFFDTDESYERVKNSGVVNTETVVKLFDVSPRDIYGIFFIDAARGIKITINKPPGMSSGDPQCRDLFGAQQHIPLMDLDIP